ncbi:hypothetical protein FA95DRAFT_1611993 [Auriscalpium vulgare]|uniref:Uncharacterized protein n=1 Tax=Auriscalpium vulgare TaxID=40419 RepID=A0ACB8R9B5_9AGAM|nr:hypothetical protein FA95DRAFT_1611993 [Auriscalpium vulgare]
MRINSTEPFGKRLARKRADEKKRREDIMNAWLRSNPEYKPRRKYRKPVDMRPPAPSIQKELDAVWNATAGASGWGNADWAADWTGWGSTDGAGWGSTDGVGWGHTDGTGWGHTDGTGSGLTDGAGSGNTA